MTHLHTATLGDAAQTAPIDFSVSLTGVLLFLALGAGLFGLTRWLGRVVQAAHLPASSRRRLLAALTAVGLATVVIYVAVAVPLIFSGAATRSPYFAVILIAGALWIGWVGLRDLFHGIAFRASGVCRVGDLVRLGAVRGRVSRLGYRHLTLVAADEEVLIPYSQAAREAVVREPVDVGAARHTFTLTPPPGVSLHEVSATARLAAFNHHWASAAHEARIELASVAPPTLEIGVYALDALRGPEIEAAVRAAIDALDAPRG